MDCCLVLVAIICPPIAVIFKSGLCSADFLINVLLTMIGYIPGLIHSFFIISRPSRRYRDFDQEGRLYITVTPAECNHQCDSQHECRGNSHCNSQTNQNNGSSGSYGAINEEPNVNPPAYSPVDNMK